MTEFNKYFEETFLIEGGYDGKEIDKSFRFDQNNKHATPKDVFDVIKQAFEDGQDMDKVEAFMRKLDIIGKDMVDNTFNYPDSNFYESLQSSSFEVSGQVIEIPHYLTDTGKLRTDSLQELCDQSNVPSKINFRNVVFVINNKTFEELYEIMNATAINFDKGIRFRNFFRESGMEQECKESEIRRKNEALDIIAPIKHDMGNGRYYINTRLRDEMAEKMIVHGPGKVIGAGATVAGEMAKSIVKGNLIVGVVKLALKLGKDSKIRKMTGGRNHFDYETFQRIRKKDYYNTSLDEIKEVDINRKKRKSSQICQIIKKMYG